MKKLKQFFEESNDLQKRDNHGRWSKTGFAYDKAKTHRHERGYWGASHGNSYAMAGDAARIMGVDGYSNDGQDKVFARWAKKFLTAISDSSGSNEPLYHGFADRKNRRWKDGDVIQLSLTATSGEMDGSASYGIRLDPKDQVGTPTVFEFPIGTKMAGYQKWKPNDAKDFGYTWGEAITAGKFRIVGTRIGRVDNWRKTPYVIVRLEPVAYFDPEKNDWKDAE